MRQGGTTLSGMGLADWTQKLSWVVHESSWPSLIIGCPQKAAYTSLYSKSLWCSWKSKEHTQIGGGRGSGATTNEEGGRTPFLFPLIPCQGSSITTQQLESRKTVALINQVSCGEGNGRGWREQDRTNQKLLWVPKDPPCNSISRTWSSLLSPKVFFTWFVDA